MNSQVTMYDDYLALIDATQAVEIEQHHINCIEARNIEEYDLPDEDREFGTYYLGDDGQPVDLDDWESAEWDAVLGMDCSDDWECR